MRQLKFRVWDNITKKFDPTIYRAGEQFGHPSSCDFVIQQSTGLIDINKKDIFEGDIVSLHHRWETSTPHNSVVSINFDGCAIITPHPKHPKYINGGMSALQNFTNCYGAENGYVTCEIIGNVFENLELLKL